MGLGCDVPGAPELFVSIDHGGKGLPVDHEGMGVAFAIVDFREDLYVRVPGIVSKHIEHLPDLLEFSEIRIVDFERAVPESTAHRFEPAGERVQPFIVGCLLDQGQSIRWS